MYLGLVSITFGWNNFALLIGVINRRILLLLLMDFLNLEHLDNITFRHIKYVLTHDSIFLKLISIIKISEFSWSRNTSMNTKNAVLKFCNLIWSHKIYSKTRIEEY